MLILALYFLAAFGLAFIVGQSKISHPFRVLIGGAKEDDGIDFYDSKSQLNVPMPPLIPYLGPFLVSLAECPGCLGFWIGLVSASTIWDLAALPDIHPLVKCVLFSQATAGSSFILNRICR